MLITISLIDRTHSHLISLTHKHTHERWTRTLSHTHTHTHIWRKKYTHKQVHNNSFDFHIKHSKKHTHTHTHHTPHTHTQTHTHTFTHTHTISQSFKVLEGHNEPQASCLTRSNSKHFKNLSGNWKTDEMPRNILSFSSGVSNSFGFAGHIKDNLGIYEPVHLVVD
jgi:hypothetical protein